MRFAPEARGPDVPHARSRRRLRRFPRTAGRRHAFRHGRLDPVIQRRPGADEERGQQQRWQFLLGLCGRQPPLEPSTPSPFPGCRRPGAFCRCPCANSTNCGSSALAMISGFSNSSCSSISPRLQRGGNGGTVRNGVDSCPTRHPSSGQQRLHFRQTVFPGITPRIPY